jgi:hypothetical protein
MMNLKSYIMFVLFRFLLGQEAIIEARGSSSVKRTRG